MTTFSKKIFLEIGRVKKFLSMKNIYHSPARIVECVAEYITFNFNKQISQTKKQGHKKAKETKEEK